MGGRRTPHCQGSRFPVVLMAMTFVILGIVISDVTANTTAATNNDTGSCPKEMVMPKRGSGVQPVLSREKTALLMLLGFGGFSILLAMVHNNIRKYVFHDEHNLDTTFDAGGNISMSLTAVTVASQLFWPGDILHSATMTIKNGIAGPFWYAVGIMTNIFIFPILSVQFKTKAPGAKTYLQIMKARFGRRAHKVFCFFAILTNVVITVGVLLAGKATIQSLTEDASDEFVILVMATLFGSYSLIGGLGTTFYVSYFNACLVFILFIVFVVKILHSSNDEYPSIGNIENMYKSISCIKGPENNVNNSYLTFRSWGAFLFGVIEVFVSSAVTYCDQASWQSRIAAKPVQGVWGFILAGFIWFSIPNVMATTTGMAYLAMSAENGTHFLDQTQINEGLVTPLIAEKILGSVGGILILTMGAMALMSTGSGEVMGLSSVIVYDIYQVYVKPYRRNLESKDCVLCGKVRKGADKKTGNTDLCTCVDATNCSRCEEDLANSNEKLEFHRRKPYSCPMHGRYREYMDLLVNFKNWCIVWVTVWLIPLGLVVFASGIDLNWIFYSGATLTIPCFPPVVLSLVWVKATGAGLVAGSLSGLVAGVVATLSVASTYKGGLSNFVLNTTQDYVILTGNSLSFGVSLVGCIIGSLLTHKIKNKEDESYEWMKLFNIDNPLQPWEVLYREDMKGMQYEGRPSMDQMSKAFRKAKVTAYIAGGVSIFIFAVFIPGILAAFPDMDLNRFEMWIHFTQAWAVIMAIIVVVLPPTEEIMRIVKQCRKNKDRSRLTLSRNGGASSGGGGGGRDGGAGRDSAKDLSLLQEAHEMVVKDGGEYTNNKPPVAV